MNIYKYVRQLSDNWLNIGWGQNANKYKIHNITSSGEMILLVSLNGRPPGAHHLQGRGKLDPQVLVLNLVIQNQWG